VVDHAIGCSREAESNLIAGGRAGWTVVSWRRQSILSRPRRGVVSAVVDADIVRKTMFIRHIDDEYIHNNDSCHIHACAALDINNRLPIRGHVEEKADIFGFHCEESRLAVALSVLRRQPRFEDPSCFDSFGELAAQFGRA
jgi:hypothetical protein